MVPETETPTAAKLAEDRAVEEKAFNDAQATMASARKALEKVVRSTPDDTEAILTAGDKVREAKVAADKAESRVASFGKRIEFAEWQSKSADLTAATQLLQAHDGQVVQGILAVFAPIAERFGIESLTLQLVAGEGGRIDTDGMSVNVKVAGSGIPKAPARAGRAPSANGGGFASHGKATFDGVEYASTNAAYRAQRPDGAPANFKSATAWLTKEAERRGVTFTQE